MTALEDVLNLAAVRGELRDFQRRTVDHVVGRMFDETNPTRRFLVADEVGLGKTFVAKGIIAEATTRLWDTGKRIDVVYVCSNAQIARQNLRRISPFGDAVRTDLADRLTLLPKTAHQLSERRVNLVSLTPGTSLQMGRATGRADERLLLYWMLRHAWGSPPLRTNGALELMRVGSSAANFARSTKWSRPAIDDQALHYFTKALEAQPRLREDFDRLRFHARLGRERMSHRDQRDMNGLVGELRELLASIAIKLLEPDLVILDEFQRFASLLDGSNDAAWLAQRLFTAPNARILLLSATPYRMLTMRGDAEDDGDHYQDFLRTLRFLFQNESHEEALAADLAAFRSALANQAPLGELESLQLRIADSLRSVMVRTERIGVSGDGSGMVTDLVDRGLQPEVADLAGYIGVERVAHKLGAGGVMDYWKSAPYLLSFLEGYQVRRHLDEAFAANPSLITSATVGNAGITGTDVDDYQSIEPGNAKLRALIADLETARAFELLWVPPSWPTTRLRGAYANAAAEGFSKRLVFSAWQAAPRAVASMLSYTAEQRSNGSRTAESRFATYDKRRTRNPLAISGRNGQPVDMAKFALLLPVPDLARLGDPRRFAREAGSNLPVNPEELLGHVRGEIDARLARYVATAPTTGQVDNDWYWVALLLLDDQRDWLEQSQAFTGNDATDSPGPDDLSDGVEEADGPQPSDSEGPAEPASGAATDSPVGEGVDDTALPWLERHALRARETSRDLPSTLAKLGKPPADLGHVVAQLAVAGPANAAWRALDQVAPPAATPEGGTRRTEAVRDAAVQMARSLRALLQSPEAEGIVRGSAPEREDYWRAALRHSLDGGLPAVLEEDLHLIAERINLGSVQWDADTEHATHRTAEVAGEFRSQAQLATSDFRVTVFDNHPGGVQRRTIGLRHHFAVRMVATRSSDAGEKRADNAREAFNGPFWPFVLVSTSVGQEGLDFHPYCHAVVHWNLPHNPVDLEQREGRVNRYKGHAVRKNVAAAFGANPDLPPQRDPWGALFNAASADARTRSQDDLVPYWAYPVEGGACIERHVPLLAMSRDEQDYADLIRTLGLYRLSFGQPRQTDLIALLKGTYDDDQELAELVRRLRIDLSPECSPDTGS